jgi:hypothetical protein
MKLSQDNVFRILLQRDIDMLCYATDVATACDFLRTAAILSGDHADSSVTPLLTECSLDFSDVHAAQHRPNKYGPVLFIFDPAVIKAVAVDHVRLTQLAEQSGKALITPEYVFQNDAELATNFLPGWHHYVISLLLPGKRLAFGQHLRCLIVDDPQQIAPDGGSLHSAAIHSLRSAASTQGITIPMLRRQCRLPCNCAASYAVDKTATAQLFSDKHGCGQFDAY